MLGNHSGVVGSFLQVRLKAGVGSLGLWFECVALSRVACWMWFWCEFSSVCVFFSISLFLVICALVLVKLCLAASRLCL